MYDIIVVGAGPAGLTSAIYACRARKKVLVLEALTYGGQIISTNKIVNYPGFKEISGVDFATNLYEQAVGHKSKTGYIYKCQKCTRTYEFSKRMEFEPDEYFVYDTEVTKPTEATR